MNLANSCMRRWASWRRSRRRRKFRRRWGSWRGCRTWSGKFVAQWSSSSGAWSRNPGFMTGQIPNFMKRCFCSTSVPLASARWVLLHFQAAAHFTLSNAVNKSQRHRKIPNKFFWGTPGIEPGALIEFTSATSPNLKPKWSLAPQERQIPANASL